MPLLQWCTGVAALLVALPGTAHHSFAMFDQSQSLPLQGVVKELRWSNPHVFIQLLVQSEDGNLEEWSIEMSSPEHLSRVGWRHGTVKAGDKVALMIHPARGAVKGGQYICGTGPGGALGAAK